LWDYDHATAGRGTQRRRPKPALERGTHAQDRAGPDLGHDVAVHLDVQHAVEDEVELHPRLVLLDQRLAHTELTPLEPLGPGHHQSGQLPFELRIRRREHSRRILSAPGHVRPERLAPPALEIPGAALLDELALVVVDPVARERARSCQRVLRRPVGVDDQLERRPGRGRGDLEERLAADAPRRRDAHPTTGALHELDPVRPAFGLVLDQRILDIREGKQLRPELHGGRTEVRFAGIAAVANRPPVDFDPRSQLVCLTNSACVAQALEVALLDAIRRRVVVVGDPELERQLRHALDRFRGEPPDRSDRLHDPHADPPHLNSKNPYRFRGFTSNGPGISHRWETSVSDVRGNPLMRKLQLVLAACAASALTAMATLVGLAGAEPNVVPANTEPPAVVGSAQDGELVVAKDGEWSGTNPMTFTYQWQRCDGNGANCASIAGATAKTYRVATADVDHRLKVQVTARNVTGSATATSRGSAMAARPAGATRLADGRASIPATSVQLPQRLVISGVEFAPRALTSRQPFTGRFRVTDTRG